jgi:cytochrome c-type biogenesis protein CcmH
MRAASLAACLLVLALAGSAAGSERRPTLAELEGEVMCPTCNTTLDHSSSPIARRMERFIARRIAAGATKSEIKKELVAEFGQAVLASPPRQGFNLLAWLVPFAGLVAGALALAVLVRRWSGARGAEPELAGAAAGANGAAPLEPELERRLDEELARLD